VCRRVATDELVSDDLWEAIEPLLPPEPLKTCGDPSRVPHRAGLAGILYVPPHGLRWRDMPQAWASAAVSVCWRRRRQWQPTRRDRR